jgi:hypothetical protein
VEENGENLNQTPENLQGPTLQQPKSTVNPQTPPQNRRFKLSIKAIIAIIIFLLLAGGVAASFTVLKPQIIKLVSKPTPTPTIVKTSTPTPDPTANWKTYDATESAFTLKYPPDWSIRPETEKQYSVVFQSSDYVANKKFPNVIDKGYSVVFDLNDQVPRDPTSVNKVSWLGKEAFVYKVHSNDGSPVVDINTPKDTLLMEVSFAKNNSDSNDYSEFDNNRTLFLTVMNSITFKGTRPILTSIFPKETIPPSMPVGR